MLGLDPATQARVIANLLDEVDELRAENARLRRVAAHITGSAAMPMRRIPQTDLDVSAVCLGTWQFCGGDNTWEGMPYADMKAIVKQALDCGISECLICRNI